jgi:hypothetical protein
MKQNTLSSSAGTNQNTGHLWRPVVFNDFVFPARILKLFYCCTPEKYPFPFSGKDNGYRDAVLSD